MMQTLSLHFHGDVQGCQEGLRLLASDYHYALSPDGLKVTVQKRPGGPLFVHKVGSEAVIRYSEKVHFFRSLGLLLEALSAGRDDFTITEEPQFVTNGAMFDVSQGNAVPRIETVKDIIKRMAVMGLNMLMLYTEDSYVMTSDPYFGYARSKYTRAELEECDAFAALFGIEMIPCMQTLAHLSNVLQWPPYAHLCENKSTLLIGEEPVYAFIERMITTASAPFRSKRIHIGMDEAWRLGLGTYLEKHGLRSKFDLMNEHLARVLEIAQRHGLEPMIWSDMYFRAASPSGGYYDVEHDVPAEVVEAMPKGVQLVYWDYDHTDVAFYRDYINRHRRFGSEPIFAGCVWSWTSFTVNWGKTLHTSNAALSACKQEGVSEVFTTVWGGFGTECNTHATLLGLQLFAEHGYASHIDLDKLQRRFEFCTGARYSDFVNMTYLDEVPGVEPDNLECSNPSKFLMWQDLLTGLFDKHIADLPLAEHYAHLAATLKEGVLGSGRYGFLFELLSQVSYVLALKANMGLRLTDAYRQNDRDQLAGLKNIELPDMRKRVANLQECHHDQWMMLYKALGWERMDQRYGALLARIDSAIETLGRFLEGTQAEIPELAAERLYFNGHPGMHLTCLQQEHITSASLTEV